MNHEIGRLKARVVAVNVTTPFIYFLRFWLQAYMIAFQEK
jgi:hypothetical protein